MSTLPESKKPDILLVISSLRPGGAERVISNMARYWSEKDKTVSLLTLTKSDQEDFFPVPKSVTRIRLSLDMKSDSVFSQIRNTIKRVFVLRRAIIKCDPDIVISFIDTANIISILATRFSKYKIIVAERTSPQHNFNLTKHWVIARKICYRYADCVIAQTQAVAKYLESTCGISHVVVIPNSIRPLPNLLEKRENLIVSIGRLSYEKGMDIVISAFHLLSKQVHDWSLLIVGDGPNKQKLIDQSTSLGLGNRISFIPAQSDPETIMAKAGIMVQASRFEGFPNVLLESMGMGAAVVHSDCPSGPGEIIQDGINGRLFPSENSEALSDVLLDLINKPNIRNTLGEKAKMVTSVYSEAIVMRKWDACIQEVLK